MNWKDWLLPWRAKAKIEELQACLNRSVDAAPFTAKINLLEDRLEQTVKSLKAALDEKHACATLLSSTRASEQDWRETASKIDLEKNELASLNRTLVDQLEHAKADVEEWKGRVKVERKEREDVEKAIGGMKAEVMEAHTLAAKASKLQEALDHEIAEHRLAKEQVVGLTKWIRVAHRLDSPSPKGTIRRILQSARFRTTSRSGTVTAMALLCFAWTALGQAPFWRNSWSTNQAPPVIGTNLWISNTASGDGWFFYNQPNSNVVARLRDITAAMTSGTNFNGAGITNLQTLPLLPTEGRYLRLLTEGDSITRVGKWQGYLTNNFPLWKTVSWYTNAGVDGEGILNLLSEYAGEIAPNIGTGLTNTLVSVEIGANDYLNGFPLQWTTNLNNYWGLIHSNGGKVVAWTVMLREDYGYTMVARSNLFVINKFILDSTNWDYLVDAASILPNPNDGDLFSDGVHPTEKGYAILASAFNDAILHGKRPRGVPEFQRGSNQMVLLANSGAPGIFINDTGRVGVGTNSAQSLVHITGTGASIEYLTCGNIAQDQQLAIYAPGSIRMGVHNFNTTTPAQLYFGNYQDSGTTRPEILFNGPVAYAGIGPTLTSGNTMRIGTAAAAGANWPAFGAEGFVLSIDGTVGVGTNNAQSKVHVQGAQAELLRVDTISGGTGALTVSSNPVVRIRTQQATNQPIGCYGAMMMPLTNILAIGPTAYTNINGYSVLNTNWFRCNTNTGTISNVFAGYYRMTISASILGGNNEAIEGCLLTNGVDSECVSFYKVYDAASRFDVLSASGLLYLPTNCQCSFGLKATTAGTVAIRRAAIVIGTP